MTDDVLSEFEGAINAAEKQRQQATDNGEKTSPWVRGARGRLTYDPDIKLLEALMAGPLREGAAWQSGRLAKAFDAWMAYELRRAQFDPSEVWPRNLSPRVSSAEADAVASKVDNLLAWVNKRDSAYDKTVLRTETNGDPEATARAEARVDKENERLRKAYEKRLVTHAKNVETATAENKRIPDPPPEPIYSDRVPVSDPLLPGLRTAINAVAASLPNNNATNVLGRFYVKQVDVVISSWQRGPDVLISGKTMFSSFAKNTKNRYEETLGEASNLRDRYPLAAMGYAFVVNDDIFSESGAYARLQDLLLRTRKPYGPYDATMLLIASWDVATASLRLNDPLSYPDPAVSQQQPPVDLSASRFFTDLLNTVIVNTPVGIHQPVRDLRNGTPVPGGAPDPDADAEDASAAEGGA